MINNLKELVRLANRLDAKSLYKEADMVDNIIKKYSQVPLLLPALTTPAAEAPTETKPLSDRMEEEVAYGRRAPGHEASTTGWEATKAIQTGMVDPLGQVGVEVIKEVGRHGHNRVAPLVPAAFWWLTHEGPLQGDNWNKAMEGFRTFLDYQKYTRAGLSDRDAIKRVMLDLKWKKENARSLGLTGEITSQKSVQFTPEELAAFDKAYYQNVQSLGAMDQVWRGTPDLQSAREYSERSEQDRIKELGGESARGNQYEAGQIKGLNTWMDNTLQPLDLESDEDNPAKDNLIKAIKSAKQNLLNIEDYNINKDYLNRIFNSLYTNYRIFYSQFIKTYPRMLSSYERQIAELVSNIRYFIDTAYFSAAIENLNKFSNLLENLSKI